MSDSPADQATTAATERAKQYKDATDKVRERSDAAAKTLVGLGTAGLTAVGISKFSDIYPFPGGFEWITAIAVVAAFLAMAAVLIRVTFLLLHANRPLVAEVDADTMLDVDPTEKEEIKRIYDKVARQNGVKAMRVYDARGQRLQRIADRKAEAAAAAPIQAKAARIRAETEAAMARATLLVSRRRMNDALTSSDAKKCAIAFATALLVFGIGADRLDSKRSGEVAAYKACADADTAGVKKLPPICDDAIKSKAPATAAAEFLAAYTVCLKTAVSQSAPLEMCDPIKARLAAAK